MIHILLIILTGYLLQKKYRHFNVEITLITLMLILAGSSFSQWDFINYNSYIGNTFIITVLGLSFVKMIFEKIQNQKEICTLDLGIVWISLFIIQPFQNIQLLLLIFLTLYLSTLKMKNKIFLRFSYIINIICLFFVYHNQQISYSWIALVVLTLQNFYILFGEKKSNLQFIHILLTQIVLFNFYDNFQVLTYIISVMTAIVYFLEKNLKAFVLQFTQSLLNINIIKKYQFNRINKRYFLFKREESEEACPGQTLNIKMFYREQNDYFVMIMIFICLLILTLSWGEIV